VLGGVQNILFRHAQTTDHGLLIDFSFGVDEKAFRQEKWQAGKQPSPSSHPTSVSFNLAATVASLFAFEAAENIEIPRASQPNVTQKSPTVMIRTKLQPPLSPAGPRLAPFRIIFECFRHWQANAANNGKELAAITISYLIGPHADQAHASGLTPRDR
jgi:hypothetical protein